MEIKGLFSRCIVEARDKQRITIDTLQLALIYLLSSSNYGISRAMSTLALPDTVASKTFRSSARLPFIIFYPTFYSSWYPVKFGFGLMPDKGIKKITEKHRYSKERAAYAGKFLKLPLETCTCLFDSSLNSFESVELGNENRFIEISM